MSAEVEEMIDHLTRAVRIVRALAAREPVFANRCDEMTCGTCDSWGEFRDHAADCPWRTAVEWVADNPEAGA